MVLNLALGVSGSEHKNFDSFLESPDKPHTRSQVFVYNFMFILFRKLFDNWF